MKQYRVMVVKYGYTVIEAETEDDAVKALNNNRYFYDFVKSPVKGLDY
jgi:transcription antitermination factor NusG